MSNHLNVTEILEHLIDDDSLLHVLTGLVTICDEKAAHIEENWQDRQTAEVWRKASRLLDKAISPIALLDV